MLCGFRLRPPYTAIYKAIAVYGQAMYDDSIIRLQGDFPLDPFAENFATLNFSAIKKAAERFFVKRSAAKK